MYARVARWEGIDQESIQRFANMVNSAEGPPDGVPSSGILVLSDSENGRGLAIALFDTEDDLRTGDATLRAMDRPPDATGRLSSVESYEVIAERRMG
jgi:hypothetical protein